MKKFILTFAIVLLGWQFTNAQALEQGNSLINVGMGFGSYMGSGTGYKTTFPPLYGSYEYMVSDNFSVGAFASYMASDYKFSFPNMGGGAGSITTDDLKWKFSYLNAGALGNYHFVNNDQLDVYGGLKLGYTSVNSDIKGSDDDGFNALLKTLKLDSSGFLFGAQVGGRYFFTEHIALNVEFGYGVAVASGGLTFVF